MTHDECSAIPAGAQEDVVKFVSEQSEDGFELLMRNRHLCGQVAFDERRRFLVTLLPSPRVLGVGPKSRHVPA